MDEELMTKEELMKCFEQFDIECEAKRWWQNAYLEKYAVLGSEALDSTDIVRLGENMMIGLTLRDSYRLGDIIVVLAVHIRKPNRTVRLIPAELLANKRNQIESLTDTDFLEQLEEKTGRLACLQVKQEGVTPLVLRDVKESSSAQSHADQSTEDNILGATENGLVAFITSVRKWDAELQACWYTFLAACICRLITRKPAAVQKHITGVVFTRFMQFYDAPLVQTPVPEPRKTTLDYISRVLQPRFTNCLFVITSFLKGLRLAVLEKDVRCKGILEFTLLIHTSYEGLQLIELLHQVMNVLGTRNVEDVIQKVRDIIPRMPEGWQKFGTSSGLNSIRKYCNHYGIGSRSVSASGGVTSMSDEVDLPFHLWCRLLNSDYLDTLQIKNNRVLAAIFCTIIEPDRRKGGVWSMAGLEMSKNMEKLISDIIRPWVAEIILH